MWMRGNASDRVVSYPYDDTRPPPRKCAGVAKPSLVELLANRNVEPRQNPPIRKCRYILTPPLRVKFDDCASTYSPILRALCLRNQAAPITITRTGTQGSDGAINSA
jgi:hypothetical protein